MAGAAWPYDNAMTAAGIRLGRRRYHLSCLSVTGVGSFGYVILGIDHFVGNLRNVACWPYWPFGEASDGKRGPSSRRYIGVWLVIRRIAG